MKTGLILKQAVTPEKHALAKKLRRSMTPAESVLWEQLRANRLRGLKFRRQQIIAGFIVDFFCNPMRLVVEVDGDVHHARSEEDARRDAVLAQHGLTVLRFTNEQVLENLAWVLEQIVRAAG